MFDDNGDVVYKIDLPPNERDKLAYKDFTDNVAYAQERCNGEVSVILIEAEDVNSTPRQMKSCMPLPRMLLKVTKFDTNTGEFIAKALR